MLPQYSITSLLKTISRSKRKIDKFFLAILILACLIGLPFFSGCLYYPSEEGSPVVTDNKTKGGIITLTDDTGRQIVLASPARRIVCLNGDAPEALIAMGAGDRVIGVSQSTAEHPELMRQMPNAMAIGSTWNNANIEEIAALNPDVVITLTSTATDLQRKLEQANITVVYLDGYILEKTPHFFDNIAIIIGTPSASRQYREYYSRYLSLINQRLSDIPPEEYPAVYIELGSEYSTAGKGSGGDSLIRLAHGRNIAGEITTQWPKVSNEWIIEQNPDVIIKTAYPSDTKNFTLSEIRSRIINRNGYSSLKAVKNNRVYVVDSRIVYGDQGIITLLYCAKAFYPEKFGDIDPVELLDEYAQKFVPGSNINDPCYPRLSPEGNM